MLCGGRMEDIIVMMPVSKESRKKGLYKMKGSYAVEAAFVVPVILGLVFAMIYMLYFLHDRAVLYGNMHKGVLDVAEGKTEYKNSTEWQEDMQAGLWMFKVVSGKISGDKLYIESDVKAESGLDIPVIGFFMESKQEIVFEDKYLAIHPEYIVRAKGVLSKD